MYRLPPDRRKKLSSEDILIAIVPCINLVVSVFVLLHPESRKRGLQMLAISLIVNGLCSATGWLLFVPDVPFLAWFNNLPWDSQRYLWIWVVAAVVVPALTMRYVQNWRLANAWKILAVRTGLDYKPGGCLGLSRRAQVTGKYRERKLELYTYHPMLIDNILDETRLVLTVANPSELNMRLEYMPTWNMISEAFKAGSQVQTGDSTFDAAFNFYGERSTLMSMVFASQELRQRLFRLRTFTTIELDRTALSLEHTGRESDADYLHFCFDVLSDLADAIEQLGR